MPAGDLEPEARRQVLEVVLDYPALHLAEVARRANLPLNLVDYHMEALLDAELVVEATLDGHRRFFPAAGPHAPEVADAEWLAMLRDPVRLHIGMTLLAADAPRTHTALSSEIDVAKSTLSFHLNKMVEIGLLARDKDGYRVADRARVRHLLVAHRPLPDLLARHFIAWLALYRETATARRA